MPSPCWGDLACVWPHPLHNHCSTCKGSCCSTKVLQTGNLSTPLRIRRGCRCCAPPHGCLVHVLHNSNSRCAASIPMAQAPGSSLCLATPACEWVHHCRIRCSICRSPCHSTKELRIGSLRMLLHNRRGCQQRAALRGSLVHDRHNSNSARFHSNQRVPSPASPLCWSILERGWDHHLRIRRSTCKSPGRHPTKLQSHDHHLRRARHSPQDCPHHCAPSRGCQTHALHNSNHCYDGANQAVNLFLTFPGGLLALLCWTFARAYSSRHHNRCKPESLQLMQQPQKQQLRLWGPLQNGSLSN